MKRFNKSKLKINRSKSAAIERNTATKSKAKATPVGATSQQSPGAKAYKKELLRGCAQLVSNPNILVEFDAEAKRIGLVGEERIAQLLLLCVITRVFSRPVSAVVKGSSSGGKNTVVMKVLKFFPRSAYYELTGMSDKALAYFSQPLKHRFLFISEAAGLQEGEGQVLLRNLLSEGYLKKEVTVGKKTKLIEVEGPTGVILTTTGIKLYHDDETRLFSVEVADTPAQNRLVVMAIAAAEAAGNGDVVRLPKKKWRALLEWIALSPATVVIPYAVSVARLMPVGVTRVRRDIKATFGLIKAHALLHQKSRQKDHAGAIVATLDDYEAVRAIVNDIMAQSSDVAVSPGVKAIVRAVSELAAAGKKATTPRLVKKMDLNRINVWRHASAAIEGGYLVAVLSKAKKRTGQYKVGDALPAEADALPSVEAVAKDWAKRTAKPVSNAGKGA
jgi:hypothetical protein